MATLTIRLPDDQHQRLKQLASRRGVSLNKLFEELSTRLLVETDTETRFRLRAARADNQAGLAVLDKLDRHFEA
jgi:predicted transcriptional regulator